jgi:hypothetical protein
MNKYHLSNGIEVFMGLPFADENGHKYPSNWLELTTPEHHAAVGIVTTPIPEMQEADSAQEPVTWKSGIEVTKL